MSRKTLHLVHLAALALLVYAFAFGAKQYGEEVAFAVLLPIGMLLEIMFWWKLFTVAR